MKKNSRITRITSALLLVALIATALPTAAFAAEDNGRYYTRPELQHEWQNATDTIDVPFDDDDVESWARNAGIYRRDSFRDVVEDCFDATVRYAAFNYNAYTRTVEYRGKSWRVENLPKAEMAAYLPQYPFSELFRQVVDYEDDNLRSRSRPYWTEINYAVFMVGLLRFHDVPARIEDGIRDSLGRYTYRVAAYDVATGREYYCDPARAILSGNHSKWQWLSETEYLDDFRYPGTYDEGNRSINTVLNPDFSTTPVEITKRFEDIGVPIYERINGERRLRDIIKMRMAVAHDYKPLLEIHDIAKMLEGTQGEFWFSFDRTLYFGLGDYRPDGTEVNWTEGKGIKMDKESPAHLLSHAYYYYGNGRYAERVPMDIYMIGDMVFADPDQVTDRLGVSGLNLNISIDWHK